MAKSKKKVKVLRLGRYKVSMKQKEVADMGASWLYRAWKNIMLRTNSRTWKHKSMKCYKGITVCDRWRDFDTFVKDMQPRFKRALDIWGTEEKLSIDRIDDAKGYEPKNVHIIPFRLNTRFIGNKHFFDVYGLVYSTKELADLKRKLKGDGKNVKELPIVEITALEAKKRYFCL